MEYGLLLRGLLDIDALGGGRTAGLGCCRVTIQRLSWNNKDWTTDQALAGFAEVDWALWMQTVREIS
jgi:hypothetical protein